MRRALVLAAVTATGSLFGLVPAAQAELRVGKNYRLNSDDSPFRGKDQVALAVNPNNPQHIVEVNIDYLAERCEGTASFDGGDTWSPAAAFAIPAPRDALAFKPSCRVGDHGAEQMFQTVEFGTGQNVYATYVTTRDNPLGGGETASSAIVVRSTDGGRTWGQAVEAMRGGARNTPRPIIGPYYELPALAVQRGAGTNGADRIYVTANEVTDAGGTAGDATVVRSDDGGQTFNAPVDADPPGEQLSNSPTQPVIAPNGDVHVAWRTRGTEGLIRSARSTNQGQSFGAPVTTATVTNAASNANTNPPQPLPSTGSSYPRMAVDTTAAGSPTRGNLYLVYNQGPAPPGNPPAGFAAADHFIPPDSDVYFQRSTNSGATWSAPKLINDTTFRPGHESPASPESFGRVTQTRHPNVSVAPNGRVDIFWEDRRHWYRGCIHTHQPCEEVRLGDTYYSFSSNGGADFSANRRINDRSHSNDIGYDYRFGWGWSFGPLAVSLSNDRLLVGWVDTREGNFDNDNSDIYLAKVDHNGPAAVPQERVDRLSNNPALSVALSKLTYPGGADARLVSGFATQNATRVVIANENDVAGTLAAGVLARGNLSQVLLSPPGGLPADVRAEVTRMNPVGAYIVGDTARLSAQIGADLQAAGVPAAQITRIAGGSDADRAHLIAETLDRRTQAQKDANTPAHNAAMIVNPASPDASAAAGFASAKRLPILFVTNNAVPSETSEAIATLDINKAFVVGGASVVSDAVMAQLPNAERLGGADQYATSRSVVAKSREFGLPANIGYVANGNSPMDGALLGSTVGRMTGLLLLAPPRLEANAANAAAGMGLNAELDRLILLESAQGSQNPPVQYPTPYPQPPTASTRCPAATSANAIRGTAAANRITGTVGADRILSAGGNDIVDALPGNDCVDLGTGNDRGQGGSGRDSIAGGRGRDRVSGSSGNDRLRGGSGNDRLDAGRGNDRAFGDGGNDLILGLFGNDVLHGVGGNDRINGSRGRDRINGGSGNDRVSGGSSNDRISGDRGNDRLVGNSGSDRISGNSGNDRIGARDGKRDRINCGTGRDRVTADRNDRVARNCERVQRPRRRR